MRPRPVVLAVAALQITLPASLLVVRWAQEGTRPASELPASWQMYSSAPEPIYTGADDQGRLQRLDVDALPPVLRAIGTGRVVVDRLCDRHPDIVVIRRDGGPEPGEFPC